MRLISGVTAILSLALLSEAGNHKAHLNRQHGDLAKRAATGNTTTTTTLQKRFSNSKWSYYDAQTGNAGACGRHIGNNEWAVALNTPQYGGGYPGPECGKTITLRYNGKTAQAVILDQCPGCPWGGLDLTPALFEYFAPHSVGIIYGEWDFGGGAPPPPEPTTTWTPPAPTTTWAPPPPTTTWEPPAPTTTWTPPAPTTTWTPPPPSTTSESQAPPSSSSVVQSSSSARPSSSASASASASGSGTSRPTGSADAPAASVAPGGSEAQGVLNGLNIAIVAFANLGAQGAAIAATAN